MGDRHMTLHTRTVHLVIPAGIRLAANQRATNIGSDLGGDHAYTAPLSPNGSEPATHYAGSGVLPVNVLDSAKSVLGNEFPASRIYRGHNDYDNEPGITRRTFDEAIADMGLQRIRVEI